MTWEGTPLEERYMDVSRRPAGRRAGPSRRQDDRRPAPQKRRAPARKTARPRRSPAVSLLIGLYKVLVVVSALIVAVYVGLRLMVKVPEQKPMDPPNQPGGQVSPIVDSSGTDGSGTPDDVLERRKGVYNIFLAATDLEGYRTDTMMVLCYDTNEQTVGVISIPRDTLVARESGNPHLVYGKGGLAKRIEDVSHMLGIPIDYYIKVNIKGFISLVEDLGGVDFYVPCDMDYDDPYQDLHIHYKQGQQKLNGQQAMEVARFRKNNDGTGYSDVGRTQTQQKLLVALAKKVLSWNSLTKINSFVETFNKNVDTDLSLNDMLYFAGQAIDLDPSTGVETGTLPGRGDGVYRGYIYCYELDQEGTLEMVNRMIPCYTRPLTLEDMRLAKASSYK